MNREFVLWAAFSLQMAGCGPQSPLPGAGKTPPVGPQQVAPGGNVPLTAARLTNVRLTSIGSKPPVEWVFKEADFFVEHGGQPLPANLAEPLLGAGVSATRVEGKWRLDVAKSELVLTELRIDDRPGPAEATLSIAPAGAVRVNIGSRQYNRRQLSKGP